MLVFYNMHEFSSAAIIILHDNSPLPVGRFVSRMRANKMDTNRVNAGGIYDVQWL